MRFSPLSFVLGVAVASVIPVASRVFRPLAVEVTSAGMGMIEDARRIIAEQMETLEDIAAEARARREDLDAEVDLASDISADTSEELVTAAGRARRRPGNGSGRRRQS
jgi:hypothetical protein